MNLSDVGSLPPTLSTRQAAEVLGVSVDHLYDVRRESPADLPVQPIELGRALRWPTAPLLRALGVEPPRVEAPAVAGASPSTTHACQNERGPFDAT